MMARRPAVARFDSGIQMLAANRALDGELLRRHGRNLPGQARVSRDCQSVENQEGSK